MITFYRLRFWFCRVYLLFSAFLLPLNLFSQDILLNSDFEDALSEWTYWPSDLPASGYAKISDRAHNGKNSLHITGNTEYAGNAALHFAQDVLLKSDSEYHYSFAVNLLQYKNSKLNSLGKNKFICVQLQSKTDSEVFWLAFKGDYAKSGWQTDSGKITIKPHAESERAFILRVYFYNLDTGDEILFDNLSLHQNTPASFNTLKRDKKITKPARTLIFPRAQLKYALFQNYLDWWIDRPLFFDRSLRYKTGQFSYNSPESFIREADIIRRYGYDGLGTIDTHLFTTILGYLDEKKDNLTMFTGFGCGMPVNEKSIASFDKIVKSALKSPNALRFDGLVVIQSYCADIWTPNQLDTLLSELRKRNGDTFLFVADLTVTIANFQKLKKDGQMPNSAREAFKEKVRSYLNVCDGVQYESAHHTEIDDLFRYDFVFDNDFYRNELVPAFCSVLSEPVFKNKLLGLSSCVGYINHKSGVNSSMQGTERLRQSMETALAAKPDFIIQSEWNEWNENTSLCPTVASGLTHERIVKYYTTVNKGQKPGIRTGDRTDLPNLVFSCREKVKIGETAEFELLNIPDGTHKKYSARLTLRSIDDKILKQYSPSVFEASRILAHRFKIGSEDIPNETVIIPELEIVSGTLKTNIRSGLPFVQVLSTRNVNYIMLKQPIRDILPAQVLVKTSHTRISNIFQVNISSPEDFAVVEILEDGIPVFAYDPSNEFFPGKAVFVISLQSPAQKTAVFSGRINLTGCKSYAFRPAERANVNITNFTVHASHIEFSQWSWGVPQEFFLTIPSDDVQKTTISFDINFGTISLRLADIEKNTRYSKSYPGRNVLTVERYTLLPDIAPLLPPGVKNLNFQTAFIVERSEQVYHLRIITGNGKIYRSSPTISPLRTSSAKTIPVFSDSKRKAVKVTMPEERIPDLIYHFSEECGDILPASDRRFDGYLGGGSDYAWPYNRGNSYPLTASEFAPVWTNIGSVKCLYFDGIGKSIAFPIETFPRESFTLSFTVFPLAAHNQVLFRHHGMIIGSLTLKIKNGKLWAHYIGARLEETEFTTDLEIPINKWSDISVSYDLEKMKFRVGANSYSQPFSKRALYLMAASFGGHLQKPFGIEDVDTFFNGYLSKLRISHFSE